MIFPRKPKVHLGAPVSFYCNSADDVNWFHQDTSSSSVTKISDSKHLIIHSVTVDNIGHYFCFAWNDEVQKHYLDEVELSLLGECFKDVFIHCLDINLYLKFEIEVAFT